MKFKHAERVIWLLALAWAMIAVWPASFWYNAGALEVEDAQAGAEILLRYNGGPERPFIGSYAVVVRDATTLAVVDEDPSGKFPYRPKVQRPARLTLEWWGPRLKPLKPGSYFLETCWTVHGRFWGLVPGKTTCNESNVFHILEAK